MEFLEHHVRALYRFLNHGEDFSDLRCIDVNTGRFVDRTIVKTEEKVVEWAKRYNGSGNCFIGRNPRNQDGTVSKVTTFSFDLDPDRPKGTSSSDVQNGQALVQGRRVVQIIQGGYLAASGNGALVLFRLPRAVSGKGNTIAKRISIVADDLRGRVDSSIKVDSTHDDARMIKLLGTMSMKGDIHRMSRFIDFPATPYHTSNYLDKVVVQVGQQSVTNGQVVSDNPLSQTQRLQMLEKALPLMKQSRCEDYDSWIKVGMALKEFGLVGYRLWNTWSKNSTKYSENSVSEKWRTFNEESGITIGSIIHWAREDSGQTIRPEPSQPKSVNRQSTDGSVFSPNGNLTGHRQRLLSKSGQGGPELSTGLPLLDRHTWGLVRGEIFTVAARTGVGKTSFATGLVKNLIESGKRVLFFSTEMSSELIVNRLLSSYTRVSGNAFRTGQFTDEDRTKLDTGYKWLESVGNRLTVCDLSGPTIQIVKDLAEKHKPDVLIFDHIQHIGGGNDVRTAISEFTRGLKDVARNHSCAVLVLSQLRRMFRDSKSGLMPAPQLSDLKESGTIEEESGQVLLLSELSQEPGSSICILLGELAKNRFGECTRVGIEFDRATANFKETVYDDQVHSD